MSMITLRELFGHDLKDQYYVEHQVLDALQTLADESCEGEMKQVFQECRQETESRITRLDEMFRSLSEQPAREMCRAE